MTGREGLGPEKVLVGYALTESALVSKAQLCITEFWMHCKCVEQVHLLAQQVLRPHYRQARLVGWTNSTALTDMEG